MSDNTKHTSVETAEVINADDLCASVYDGILRLFQDHDAVERAKKIMKDRPAIMAVVENLK